MAPKRREWRLGRRVRVESHLLIHTHIVDYIVRSQLGQYPYRGPKRDFMLSLGFALQRANSRMLRNADRRRRLARMSGKYSSGTLPLSSDDDY